MKKSFAELVSTLFILFILGFIYYTMMPRAITNDLSTLSEFSTDRAFTQVESISQYPHYVGSKNHETVASYLQSQLHELGLTTTTQEGYTLTDWGNLAKSKNILARIKGSGNGKALLLLSHYDSAPHSASKGASDAGSGVASILEGIRAFQNSKKKHKNDIIILFTDAEELGLNGAALFVTEHPWAKDVGVVLNFEARGTSGPSYMLMEANVGNKNLIENFAAAAPQYPVTNSLMYSIYKMLPNDTDLTVFREKGAIQGYNFAFIDGHYNYHTAQDISANLDKTSLSHQGAYLMPLLDYFSNSILSTKLTTEDNIYFNIPFTVLMYPFSWALPMAIIALILFIVLVFIGLGKKLLTAQEIIKGFIPLLSSLLITFITVFVGWKLVQICYPQYNDLLNGFTYNGHDYIAAFTLLTLALNFALYQLFSAGKKTMNHYVAALFIWLVINIVLAIYLTGAGFLIIPVYCGLLSLTYFVITQHSSKVLNVILAIPTFILIVPFIQMLPIGLGLKILYGSALLTSLTFALLLPVFGAYRYKIVWSSLLLLGSVFFFIKADQNAAYGTNRAKSNSLLYVYNADTNKASWATYDTNLDSWTKNYLGQNPKLVTNQSQNKLFSKYNSDFTYQTITKVRPLKKPTVIFEKDSIARDMRYLKIKIIPNRKVNRYDLFAGEQMNFYNFTANRVTALEQKGNQLNRKGRKLLSYYVVDNEALELNFAIPKSTIFDMKIMESSFDLLENPSFNMVKRANWMMPTPFVLNDAIVIEQQLIPTQNVATKAVEEPKVTQVKQRRAAYKPLDTTSAE